MKLTASTNLFVIGLALTITATGCKHRAPAPTPLPNAGMTGEQQPGPGGTIPPGGTGPESTASMSGIPQGPGHPGWAEDPAMFKADIVYFDFDSSVVKPDEKSKAAAVADYLKGNSADAVKIEGYCDERGTEEYNRALGERRALALREQLISLGVDADRVDTISFGKDRPADPGHNESAWRKNRRGEFVLLTPPK